MAQTLFDIARQALTEPAAFRARHAHPWLVWEASAMADSPIVAPTLTLGGEREKPARGDPLAFPVKKSRATSFSLGVTLGRTENNDVVLRHQQVSRFHAYVQSTPEGMAIVDADSKNGTFVDGVRLAPSRPQKLGPSCELRFGHLVIRYFSADAFLDHLEAR